MDRAGGAFELPLLGAVAGVESAGDPVVAGDDDARPHRASTSMARSGLGDTGDDAGQGDRVDGGRLVGARGDDQRLARVDRHAADGAAWPNDCKSRPVDLPHAGEVVGRAGDRAVSGRR